MVIVIRFSGSAFLSSLAQDFIEDDASLHHTRHNSTFLSSLAQDFIEELDGLPTPVSNCVIPELSSSGLH